MEYNTSLDFHNEINISLFEHKRKFCWDAEFSECFFEIELLLRTPDNNMTMDISSSPNLRDYLQ